jgi:hypothetical protein
VHRQSRRRFASSFKGIGQHQERSILAKQRLNLPLQGQCVHRKARFYSRAVAEARMEPLAESDRVNRPSAGPLNTYWCGICSAWHIGHVSAVSPWRHQVAPSHEGTARRFVTGETTHAV